MKLLTPFRIATYLLVLYGLAHTAGGMLAEDSLGPSADAVFAQMKAVTFDFNGSTSTWYGFWFGFGIMVSVFLAASAFIAWKLDAVPPDAWPVVSPIAWTLVVAHGVNAVLGWRYFFAGPALFGVAITTLLAVGAWRKGALQRAQAAAPVTGRA